MLHWTVHALHRLEHRTGRFDLVSKAEVDKRLAACKDELSKSGQTGVRIKRLHRRYTLLNSYGDEVWAVVDEGERVVTLMLRVRGQSMNHQWVNEVK